MLWWRTVRQRSHLFTSGQVDDGLLVSGQPILQMLLCQQQNNFCLFDDVLQTLLRILRVQGHIGPSSLQDSQQPHDHFDATLHVDTNVHFRTDSQSLQAVCQLVGSSIEVCIAEHLLLKDQCDGVSSAFDLLLKELVYTPILWIITARGIPLH